MDLSRRQMYAVAIIAMALAMIAVGLGFGVRVAIKKPTAKPTGMYAVGPVQYASKLPAIKPASVPSLGPKPQPAPKPGAPAPKPVKAANCTKTGPWPTGRKACSKILYPSAWTRTGGACVEVKRDCNGPAIDPSKNLYESKGACEKACAPAPAPAVYVPTAPASPAPGIVKLLLDPSNRRGNTTPRDPRLAQLPPPVQSELARLAVRGTATEIRNATVDLGGSTVGVLGGEFAGAPVGPDDVSAINQYLDQLSRQPASLLAGN